MTHRTAHRTTHRVAAALTVLAASLMLVGCSDAEPAGIPAAPSDGNVLDAADVLSGAEEQELTAQIDAFNARTDAARVAILTVDGAAGSIEDFAREVATEWGVGDDGANNGVLIIADTGERELRIETADGVRVNFSDDDAEDVVEDVLEPAFADEEYAEGLRVAVDEVYLYADGNEPAEEPFNWGLLAAILAGIVVVVGGLIAWISAAHRKLRREIEDELAAAEEADPDFRLTEEQREAYRKYRYGHRSDDDVSTPSAWLPLYIANPSLYSGGSSSSSSSGSSFNGGGGFTGGGASGSY